MIRIMFVCHGNICRSPMAEFVMKKLVRDRGLENRFYILSAATHTDEIWDGRGSPIYPPAREQLIKHSIPFDEGKRATLLTKEDYDSFDYFACMDDENVRCMNRIFGTFNSPKIKKLMSFTNRGGSVSDPWYTRDFGQAYDDIYSGCTALLDYLTEEKK